MDFDNSTSSASWDYQSILDRALGRWPWLLSSLGGLAQDQLTSTHQPCPACGGDDRYRWLTDEGPGGWYCSHCGGKGYSGGGGSGIDLLMRVRGWTFGKAIREMKLRFDGLPFEPVAQPRQKPSDCAYQPGASELSKFALLDMAGEIRDSELFSPSAAKLRTYSKRWSAYTSANPLAAHSIELEFETCSDYQPASTSPQGIKP